MVFKKMFKKDDKIKQSELINKLLRITLIIYLISFILILVFRTIFAYMNGEEPIESFMLNYRSFLLGSLNEAENIFSTRFTSVGVFSIHFIIFFALLLYKSIFINADIHILQSSFMVIIGCILSIFMYENFLFCLPEAIVLAGLLGLISKIPIYQKIIKNEKKLVNMYKIFLIFLSIIALFVKILPYIGE